MSLADLFSTTFPEERGVAFRAYHASAAGPADADVVLDVLNQRAVSFTRFPHETKDITASQVHQSAELG